MPCYDGRDRNPSPKAVYESGISPNEMDRAKKQIQSLTAALCATYNELRKRGIDNEVAVTASRNGLIDLVGFLNQHRVDDASRLLKELHKYSKGEQEIIRALLNDAK